jgi:putative hemolysin
VTEAEISASLEEGVDAGIIEEHEHQMVRNVFHLDDRPLTSMMLPRAEIAWFNATDTVGECLRQASTSGDKGAHSWYPVCRGSLDNIVGAVRVARMLDAGVSPEDPVENLVEAPSFVPETLTGMELIEQFRVKTARMVFVVDEYGGVQGLITPLDLLETITGELQPDVHEQAWAVELPDGSWELDGLMPVSELKSRLDIEAELPFEGRGRYNTLAGLLMTVTGDLPARGARIACAGWIFEVKALDGKRLDQLIASRQR